MTGVYMKYKNGLKWIKAICEIKEFSLEDHLYITYAKFSKN